jgi:hypothetical protein
VTMWPSRRAFSSGLAWDCSQSFLACLPNEAGENHMTWDLDVSKSIARGYPVICAERLST